MTVLSTTAQKYMSHLFYIGYKYLTDNGLAPIHEYSYEEVSSYLGYSVKDMWNRFMPDLPQSEKDTCSKIIGDSMMELINKEKISTLQRS